MSLKKAVVVCPGRGSYTKETLGYLNPHYNKLSGVITALDQFRAADGYPTISELDSAKSYKVSTHSKGEHASTLIYACSYLDYLVHVKENYDVQAVLGNSMGWYLALAMSEALNLHDSYKLIQGMGSMMVNGLVGGQVITSVVDESWQPDQEKSMLISALFEEANNLPDVEIYPSIYLGGYLVMGGNKKGLEFMLNALPKEDPYPFQLLNHGAFHTPLLSEISRRAFKELNLNWNLPKVPIIDGQGKVWSPYSSNLEDLRDYTLGHQVTQTYDFTKSIEVALQEYNPDHLILLGPGGSLGGAIGQTLVKNNWQGINSKEQFKQRQERDPFLISLG
ncbi:MAG: ACP S-malonyltransferase [Bdellovibrionaceae bacterium]|jgi:[acyl-carrier-protein] S-malonyltransferase|nr:ACP S-malonyltransferase [Pseudobdellovibrionaceae bacterium]